jgi:hypothetical protein
MPYYRAYVVGPDGVFRTVHSLDCEDDAAAIETARQYVNGCDVEVWQQKRRITRLLSKPK